LHLTKRQKNILSKAKIYKHRTIAKPYTRLYWEFCREEYIAADKFRQLVFDNQVSNVTPITQVKPAMDLDKYIHLCEAEIISKRQDSKSA